MTLIIILFAIAGLLLLKYSEMLGKTTGEERPRDWLRPDADAAEDAPHNDDSQDPHADVRAVTAHDSDSGQALIAAKVFEPRLDLGQFMDGACKAYEMILVAYENGDKDTLRPLLEDEVYDSFAAAIDSRAAAGLTVDARALSSASAEFEEARLDKDSRRLEIDLRLRIELITAVYNVDGDLVDGDPDRPSEISGVWTFARRLGASDPTWTVAATE